MERILKLAEEIRAEVDVDLYRGNSAGLIDDWTAVLAAVDYLEDTGKALRDYEQHGFGRRLGEKYIRFYGFLQAVFLQQDAIRQMYKEINGKPFRPSRDSAWMRIRDLRNLTVGHPIDYKGRAGKSNKCVFLRRIDLEEDAVRYQIWDRNTGAVNFEDPNIEELYEQYKDEAVGWLKEVLEKFPEET